MLGVERKVMYSVAKAAVISTAAPGRAAGGRTTLAST